MRIIKYYTTFSGRLSLGKYWLTGVLPWVVLLTLGILFDLYVLEDPDVPAGSLVIWLLWLVPYLSILARRCHDRNRSAYFILLLFVPVVGIWPAIELAFVRGTSGENRFGPDPTETGLA